MGKPQPLQLNVRLTYLDRLVGWFDPRRGYQRFTSRVLLQRAYDAASPGDRWRPRRTTASANADHQADAGTIRGKARMLSQNVPYIAAGLEALTCNTIGTGITTFSTAPDAERRNAIWAEWCKVCDADGRLDWPGMQAAASRAMDLDGEVLLRLRPRQRSDGLPVPLQLQLLEIDWLDGSRSTGAVGTNQIINGIEYDVFGRVAAYWLWDQHPGDLGFLRRLRRGSSKRVSAENIIHFFNPERPGQGRGFSRLAPVITRARDLHVLEDAEIARKNLESRYAVLASADPASMGTPAPAVGALEGKGTATNGGASSRSSELGDLPSGAIVVLPPGMNVTTVAPHPAPGHVENVKHHLHMVAVGMGVTYEALTGDMREVNFSSARVRQSDFRRQIEQRQWLCIIPRLIVPVWQAFNQAGVLAGHWSKGDLRCDHSTPKWDYVNPEQDAKSELSLIAGGLLTISESLRRRGYKPEAVFAELKSDFERLKADGVLDILLMLQKGKQLEGEKAKPGDAGG